MEELLKTTHRRPESDAPGYIIMGGWDEAFEYWTGFCRFWDRDALDWLRATSAKTESPMNRTMAGRDRSKRRMPALIYYEK
jgi:hypothetical protein